MRLLFLCLVVLLHGVTGAVATVPETQVPSGAWEVLEGCRLVKMPANDGDSFKVAYQDRTFVIRLYFVDCPETYDTYKDRLNSQAQYFSISSLEVIVFGKTAKAYTQKFLKGEFTVITRWEDARGGGEMRYFGIVRKEDRLLSEELVRNGLARIYGMPTQTPWPGGFAPQNYVWQLKQYERAAQQAGYGIWGKAQGSVPLADSINNGGQKQSLQAPVRPSTIASASAQKIILNKASAAELDTLPGIGPALADRIIAARPFTGIEELANIPGISIKKINAFRDRVIVDKPPPPLLTAEFYLSDLETYLDTEITVQVAMVSRSDQAAPEGFHAVSLETANQNRSGGSITAFIPDEYYDSFVEYYRQPNRKFTGFLFEQDSAIALVYRRK